MSEYVRAVESAGGWDFLRVALVVAAAGAFVFGEWLLGVTGLVFAIITSHGFSFGLRGFGSSPDVY